MAFNKRQPAFLVPQQSLQGIGKYFFAPGPDIFGMPLVMNHQFTILVDSQCPRLIGNGVGIDEVQADVRFLALISGDEAPDGAAQVFLFPGIGRDGEFPGNPGQYLPAGRRQ